MEVRKNYSSTDICCYIFVDSSYAASHNVVFIFSIFKIAQFYARKKTLKGQIFPCLPETFDSSKHVNVKKEAEAVGLIKVFCLILKAQ